MHESVADTRDGVLHKLGWISGMCFSVVSSYCVINAVLETIV